MDTMGQIYRSSEINSQLINQYADELQRLAKKAGIDKPIGFSKSVTLKNNECYETTIVFYQDKDGEMHDRIVRARLLSYGTTGQIDTASLQDQEPIVTDSLSFKAKSVSKSKDGYLVVGNVSDKGVEIPVVLSTGPKAEPKKQEPVAVGHKFADNGNIINANGRAVGCQFKCLTSDTVIMVKLLRNDHVNDFYGRQTDNCYSSTFIVPVHWWNGGRSGMGWDRQVAYMKQYFLSE